jgi:hypothetical protein
MEDLYSTFPVPVTGRVNGEEQANKEVSWK